MLSGWTFFDLNAIYEEHENDKVTNLQADFVSTKCSYLSYLQVMKLKTGSS